MKKFITWMLACFILISTVAGTASNVQAATVSQNNPVNGDYSYYAVYGTIYRVNNQTGKNKKIKALKDAFEIFGEKSDLPSENRWKWIRGTWLGTDSEYL